MFDNLYKNIGGKIKSWAKWIFIVEAIGAIITGVVLMATDEDLIVYGLLTLVCGPIIAWVGSWILYAFGQLVEDVHAMRDKEGTTEEVKAKREAEEKAKHEVEKNQYVNNAMNMRTNSTVPYWCGKCGYDGPYDGNCPKCNSSLKKYNV